MKGKTCLEFKEEYNTVIREHKIIDLFYIYPKIMSRIT